MCAGAVAHSRAHLNIFNYTGQHVAENSRRLDRQLKDLTGADGVIAMVCHIATYCRRIGSTPCQLLSDNYTAAEPVLQVGLADRGDSTAHLQVCLCSEARKSSISWWEKEKNSTGGGV